MTEDKKVIDSKEDIKEEEIVDEISSEEVESEKIAEDIDSEINLIKDKYVRLQADFANYKRRTESEKKDYIDIGSEKIILGLLPIIDNFERALNTETNEKVFKEGIEMIYNQFLELLEKNGIEEIEAINTEFDPNKHHAVLVEPKDGVKEGIVIEVLQKGYKKGDKIIRPSMVKVSQ